jgi:hypothetical protein
MRDRSSEARRFLLWAAVSSIGVAAGLRFFPRYYFQILPVFALVAARGLTLMKPVCRAIVLALLLIPLLRFGPRYVTLASDLIHGRPHQWFDIAMNQDSKEAAELLHKMSDPNDTLLVWGYRPDVFCYSGLAAATRFLDSQPLTGVLADRHLFNSTPSAPDIAARNRLELVRTHPTFIVDGLGRYNPALAIGNFDDLKLWLSGYTVAGRTAHSVIYKLLPTPNGGTFPQKR